MTSGKQRYHEFYNCGENFEGQKRWVVDVQLEGMEWWELTRGNVISNWNPDTVVDCQTLGPVEDMPWADFGLPIVSDRLRRLLEGLAPDHAQYLPVRMAFRGKVLNLPPYWLANWLGVVDCIDRRRSVYEVNQLRPDRFRFMFLVIDPELTGPSGIFRVKDYLVTVLVSQEIHDEIESSGITGCQFYNVCHSGDDLGNYNFDPKALGGFDFRFKADPNPALQIDRVHKWVPRSYMPDAEHYRGQSRPEVLRTLLTEVGNRVRLSWRGDQTDGFCRLVLQTPLKSTANYDPYVELEGKRYCIIFHCYMHDVDEVRFGFWGPPAFISLVRKVSESLGVCS